MSLNLSEQVRRETMARMIRSRVFEEHLEEEFARQRDHAGGCFGGRNSAFEDYNETFRIPIQGNLELSIGQEAGPASACTWLRDDDYAAGTHRSHALALSKGVRMADLLAELYGKSTGLCGGRAGDFMLNDKRVNFENSAVMGQLTAVSLGFAFAAHSSRSDRVASVFIGDGASNQGVVHEAMNLASLWQLPVVFVIEDNGYAISTPRTRSAAIDDLSRRSIAYGMPGVRVDDRSVDELLVVFQEAVARARAGRGPSLVVTRTRRLRGAFEGDNQQYRPAGELIAEESADALSQYEALLLRQGLITREWISQIRGESAAEFVAALHAAQSAPRPDSSSAPLGVFA